MADFHTRALENRVRANNWISETCPAGCGVDLTRPWVLHNAVITRQRRIHQQVMKNSSCPFEEWQKHRRRSQRRSEVCARMRMAGVLGGLRSEGREKIFKDLREIYEHEAKEPMSKAKNQEVEEIVTASRAALRQAAKGGQEEDCVAAIRLAEMAGIQESEIEPVRRSLLEARQRHDEEKQATRATVRLRAVVQKQAAGLRKTVS